MINRTIKILAFQKYFFLPSIPPHPEREIFVTKRVEGIVNIPTFVLENKNIVVNVYRYLFCYFAITM